MNDIIDSIENKLNYAEGHLDKRNERKNVAAICMVESAIDEMSKMDNLYEYLNAEEIKHWKMVLNDAIENKGMKNRAVLEVINEINIKLLRMKSI